MSETHYTVPFDAPEPSRLAPLFPGYSIECLIATGGMGAVYKAVQVSLDRPVAIKILPREFGQDQEFRTSFATEAKTMARLNHPNLIGVYDFGEVDGMLFIIMEFVPGKTLFHSAHGMAVAQDEAARIVVGVCEALAHAHEHGILHRDIKPGNILLDQMARPKIGDFGLARPIGAAIKDGETIFGTPHYTAPEVLKYPNSVDARADIFSVGVLFHELLTGKLPATDPRPPSAISGCDPRFDAIIRRATHPSPELRYPSAAEMAKEIKTVAATFAATAARARAPMPAVSPIGGRPQPYRGTVGIPAKSSNAGVVFGTLAIAAALVVAILVVTKGSKPLPSPGPTTPTDVAKVPTPEPPKPNPKPEQEPETGKVKPAPEPEPAPKPEPEPEVVKVEPEKVKPPPMPTFDVPAFLEKARAITRQRATPFFAEQAKELEKNMDAFERRVNREVRDLDKFRKVFVEPRVEESFVQWRKDGNRLPKTLNLGDAKGPWGFPGGGRDDNKGFFDTLTKIHAEFLAKQVEIDEKVELNMIQLANTVYLLGLRMQIQRLTDPNEAPSVDLITQEVDAVQQNVKYFIALMQGMTTAAAKDVADGDLDKEKDDKQGPGKGKDDMPDQNNAKADDGI